MIHLPEVPEEWARCRSRTRHTGQDCSRLVAKGVPTASALSIPGSSGGRARWAHFNFTRMNVELTFQQEEVEDARVVRALLLERETRRGIRKTTAIANQSRCACRIATSEIDDDETVTVVGDGARGARCWRARGSVSSEIEKAHSGRDPHPWISLAGRCAWAIDN